MKIHRNQHSYQNKGEFDQSCKKCDFQCKTMESMEVHIGRHKVEYFECGLCDIKFETLETHLNTCEIRVCKSPLRS